MGLAFKFQFSLQNVLRPLIARPLPNCLGVVSTKAREFDTSWTTAASNDWQSTRYPQGSGSSGVQSHGREVRQVHHVLIPQRMPHVFMLGDMIYMSVLGKNIYIVSSIHILNDLFNKRSLNYSDRPYSTMLNKL